MGYFLRALVEIIGVNQLSQTNANVVHEE